MYDEQVGLSPAQREADLMEPITFNCPKCGRHDLEYVQDGMAVYTEIFVYGSGEIDYRDEVFEESKQYERRFWYECSHCAYRIESNGHAVTDPAGLLNWLLANQKDKR